MNVELVVIGDDSTRAGIISAIEAIKAKRDRMPSHWVDRRQACNDAIDDPIDRYLKADD